MLEDLKSLMPEGSRGIPARFPRRAKRAAHLWWLDNGPYWSPDVAGWTPPAPTTGRWCGAWKSHGTTRIGHTADARPYDP